MESVKTLPAHEAFQELNLPVLEGNLFSSPEWLRVLKQTYNTRFFIKYIERNGSVDSYIVYSVVRNFLDWKICICSYCDYCDGEVKSAADWEVFYQSLRKEYPEYRIAIRNLRDETARQCSHFKELSKERFHLLDIQDSVEDLWSQTSKTFKVAVKRAQKNNLTVRKCTREELYDFFRIHLNLRKNKYRLFPQPQRFFRNIWNEFMEKDNGVLLGCFDSSGKMIAGNIYLFCGYTAYYKFSASHLDVLNMKPNNLLLWEGIKYAREKGCDYVDLGSSGYDQDGLIWFKTHILPERTTQMDITHLGFAPENYKYSNKIILSILTKFFTQSWMPESLVRFGSNIIYHYLA